VLAAPDSGQRNRGCDAFEVVAFPAFVELLTQDMLVDIDRLGGLVGEIGLFSGFAADFRFGNKNAEGGSDFLNCRSPEIGTVSDNTPR